ncbi:hypothetical protein MLD38_022648 [Melastoma candidum]|uniref:Uncharacterized protein n=1 Tax=Melastoma candidum TaxID=119954 RepID=A0ACB9QKI8_9MYRT|nr:hypothetical protein MLD38_022648 [Melastoma candidum]
MASPEPLLRIKFPVSSSKTEETPLPAVPVSQTVAPDETTRRKLPSERSCREPEESTEAPGDQMTGMPPL